MLPSHLLDPTKKKNERLNRTRLGFAPPPPLPSLCLTGAMSRIGRYQVVVGDKRSKDEEASSGDETCDGVNSTRLSKSSPIDDNNGHPVILSYCIFRPRQLHDANRPPLLCLHGGPSIPSNYMLPIVNGVTDRAVIFYDQWGCGKSSRPQLSQPPLLAKTSGNKAQHPPFSIPTMVEHLRQLVQEHWKLKRFHLLGHSFGGILAYEYLLTTMKRRNKDPGLQQRQQSTELCSLVLSSTPVSAKLIQSESQRLFRNLNDTGGTGNTNVIGNGADDDDGIANAEENSQDPSKERQEGDSNQSMKFSEEFRQTHECRLAEPPLSLLDAFAQMGPTNWRGIPAIDGYEANEQVDASYQVPTLLMRGEYDFCTELCMKGWNEKLWSPSSDCAEPEEKVLSNCSHYAMLEDENLYGAEILGFLRLNDEAHR